MQRVMFEKPSAISEQSCGVMAIIQQLVTIHLSDWFEQRSKGPDISHITGTFHFAHIQFNFLVKNSYYNNLQHHRTVENNGECYFYLFIFFYLDYNF